MRKHKEQTQRKETTSWPTHTIEEEEQADEENINERVIQLARAGEIGKASNLLEAPTQVMTETLCSQIDPAGQQWKQV